MKNLLEYKNWASLNEGKILSKETDIQNGLIIMKGIIDRGFTKEEAAGWVGNMFQESNFNHIIDNTTGSGAFGLIQWLGGRRDSMLKDAGKTYATRKQTTIDNQLDFLKKELTTKYINPKTNEYTDYEKRMWAKATTQAKPQNTPEAWAKAIDKWSVRSGGSALSTRSSAARTIYDKYVELEKAASAEEIAKKPLFPSPPIIDPSEEDAPPPPIKENRSNLLEYQSWVSLNEAGKIKLPGSFSTRADNNPFNIIMNDKTLNYKGVTGYKIASKSGKSFVVFDTLENGIRAGLSNLSKYFTVRKLFTVKAIIQVYAGGSTAYTDYVTSQLKKAWNPKVTSTTKLPEFKGYAETNKDTILMFKTLAKAIFVYEGGDREFLPAIDEFDVSKLPGGEELAKTLSFIPPPPIEFPPNYLEDIPLKED